MSKRVGLTFNKLRIMVRPCSAGSLPRIPTRTFVTEAASLTEIVQGALSSFQSFTELPWWATLACSTAFVRLSLLPLVRKQILISRKFGDAMPELAYLHQLLQQRLVTIPRSRVDERMHVLSVFLKGVKSSLVLHDVSALSMVLFPVVNIAVFVTFVWATRDYILHSGNSDLLSGGLLWFGDLTVKDSSFALPLTALGLSYAGIEYSFSGGKVGKFGSFLKNTVQSFMILSIPFVVALPSGVFCYWIPSSLIGIFQTAAMRSPWGMKLLNIPPLPPKATPSSNPSAVAPQ